MTRPKVFKCIGLAVAAALLVNPAFGILGVGDIVYDPTNYANAVQRFLQLQKQYAQMVQTYQVIQNQYQQMLFMAQPVPVNMITRYRALMTPWLSTSATNTYGTTSGWLSGINFGQGVQSGYSLATQPLSGYGDALGNVPADQLARVKTNYATVELTDGANLNGIATIGQMRANSTQVEAAIKGLEDDSLSPDRNMNTEIAVLNKINAAHLIMVRNTQDANKLLVALTEQQIINAKRTRDAEAQAINEHIRFMSEGKAAMDAQAAGASQAMLAWRMP
jgi:hypothetical protein